VLRQLSGAQIQSPGFN